MCLYKYVLASPQVAALYDELKKRVAHFNMHVNERASLDPDYKHKQRFILQVYSFIHSRT